MVRGIGKLTDWMFGRKQAVLLAVRETLKTQSFHVKSRLGGQN